MVRDTGLLSAIATHDMWVCSHLTSFLCLLQSGIRYPVVVRFSTVNYAGVSTNNYGLEEVEQL